MITGTIGKNPGLNGSVSGMSQHGLSTYDLAVRYLGYNRDVVSWLESLKAFSPKISPITEENGNIIFTITDEDGDHQVTIPCGRDITIDSTNVDNDGNVVILFSDGTSVLIPKGQDG